MEAAPLLPGERIISAVGGRDERGFLVSKIWLAGSSLSEYGTGGGWRLKKLIRWRCGVSISCLWDGESIRQAREEKFILITKMVLF